MMRRGSILAVALAMAGLVSASAGAQTFINANIAVDTQWGVPGGSNNTACTAANPIVLNQAIFVTSGATLEIGPGCVVRGQPRAGAGATLADSPGALIVTQGARIEAVGQPNNPIIFTTAATDTNNDQAADDSNADGFLNQWNGVAALLDENPLGAPLAPLNGGANCGAPGNNCGSGNVQLWGGIVLLGNAPINQGASGGPAYGTDEVEGLAAVTAVPALRAYGGKDPHDSSGIMSFVSIRHAGDPIDDANELNCLTIAGIGDGTTLSHIECYANWDDGFEWFGGTVDGSYLFAHAIADDHFDVDQGYTGVNQFLYALAPHFVEDSGADYGSADTARMGEWDGDDADANTRIEVDGTLDPDQVCWPLQAMNVFNMTLQGPVVAGANNAVSDQGPMVGMTMRNGFAGKVHNSVVVNTGTGNGLEILGGSACGEETADHVAAELVWVMSTSFDDSVIPAGSATTALTNGNNNCVRLGATAPGCNNNTTTFAGLRNEQNGYQPKGTAAGKLASVLLNGLNGDLDPRTTGFAGTGGGVPPYLPGTDSTATFRGAFAPGGPNWLTGRALDPGAPAAPGWTTLSNAGMVVDF